MLKAINDLFDESGPDLRARIAAIYVVLAVLNVGAWLWALVAFGTNPTMLGVALVIYGLGLRHAVDADHIAAIDNVTRKLMQDRRRPVAVGFFFALGHSAVVVIAAAAVAVAATLVGSFDAVKSVGGLIGTGVSAVFLLAIAAMNVTIFASIYRSYRRVRQGGIYVEEDLDLLLNDRGLLARIFRPMFRLVSRSWHMFPLGFLFGLGFDTASEVAMFGVSAAQAAKGIPVVSIMVFPALFAAGMSLVDTTDGVMMLGVYDWAFVRPMRKLYYNMTITLVSVIVAVLIGGIEALGLVGDQLDLKGSFWDGIGGVERQFQYPRPRHHRGVHRRLGAVFRDLQGEAPRRCRDQDRQRLNAREAHSLTSGSDSRADAVMAAPMTSGLRQALAAVLIFALTLAGMGRAVATMAPPFEAAAAVAGVPVPICHSGPGIPSDPAGPSQHDCCDACALMAPVLLPGAPTLTSPASVAPYAVHARAVAWVPALARPRSPRQSRGPPAA